MLARLSSADYPALAPLKTRDDDDFSIALLDATAVVLDILTFYQERLANESYLRTATQLHSLTRAGAADRLSAVAGRRGLDLPRLHAQGRDRPAGRSDDDGDHDPGGHPGAERAGAGTDAADLRDLGRHPGQGRLERAAGADRRSVDCRRSARTSVYLAGHRDAAQPGDAILIVGDERCKRRPAATAGMCGSSARCSPTPSICARWSPGRSPRRARPRARRRATP